MIWASSSPRLAATVPFGMSVVNITASRTNSRGSVSATHAKRTSPPRGDASRGLHSSRDQVFHYITYGAQRPEDTLTHHVATSFTYLPHLRGCMYAAAHAGCGWNAIKVKNVRRCYNVLDPTARTFFKILLLSVLFFFETGTLGWRTFSKKEWTENADFQ